MNVFNRLSPYSPYILSIVRIVAGLIFMAHGTAKLLGFPASDMNPAVGSLPWIAGCIELVGGLFPCACAEQLLPRPQWRRRGNPLLLPVPVSRFRRPGSAEHRRFARQGLIPNPEGRAFGAPRLRLRSGAASCRARATAPDA
jgi:hypothetical protein